MTSSSVCKRRHCIFAKRRSMCVSTLAKFIVFNQLTSAFRIRFRLNQFSPLWEFKTGQCCLFATSLSISVIMEIVHSTPQLQRGIDIENKHLKGEQIISLQINPWDASDYIFYITLNTLSIDNGKWLLDYCSLSCSIPNKSQKTVLERETFLKFVIFIFTIT